MFLGYKLIKTKIDIEILKMKFSNDLDVGCQRGGIKQDPLRNF